MTPHDIVEVGQFLVADGIATVAMDCESVGYDVCLRFKSSVPAKSWWVGSIPMHFRHLIISTSYNFLCTEMDTRFSPAAS